MIIIVLSLFYKDTRIVLRGLMNSTISQLVMKKDSIFSGTLIATYLFHISYSQMSALNSAMEHGTTMQFNTALQ